jgi:hypothetical protein
VRRNIAGYSFIGYSFADYSFVEARAAVSAKNLPAQDMWGL